VPLSGRFASAKIDTFSYARKYFEKNLFRDSEIIDSN
jgi:hypothetical protein